MVDVHRCCSCRRIVANGGLNGYRHASLISQRKLHANTFVNYFPSKYPIPTAICSGKREKNLVFEDLSD
ncbi:catalase [Corchorus olitorius]|uniref:Catalase n=1 Tax=Corchorus olitorius TaxID=93759 RepID=A0A1R3IAK3_9ROSI|nr:catalase [Corchorus olitorius]